MCQIVADVSEDTATEGGDGCVPIVEEDCVGEPVEGGCQGEEEGRGHDEAVSVHGEVVVNAVEDEVGCDAHAIVGEISRRRF